MASGAPKWLVLTWRLPSSLSTPRVATWRSLRRVGAVTLTPGAAIVPYSEDLDEQLGWIADDITRSGGDAYVLPVLELPEADEAEIRRRMTTDSESEFGAIADEAGRLVDALRALEPGGLSGQERLRVGRELRSLKHRLDDATARNHAGSPLHQRAATAVRAVQGVAGDLLGFSERR